LWAKNCKKNKKCSGMYSRKVFKKKEKKKTGLLKNLKGILISDWGCWKARGQDSGHGKSQSRSQERVRQWLSHQYFGKDTQMDTRGLSDRET